LIYKFVFYGVPFAGFGTIICLMLLLFGFLFVILGLIGEYIAMIFEEVKSRPAAIVEDAIGF
jgi:dolichol-phosphate mannosyltransferase